MFTLGVTVCLRVSELSPSCTFPCPCALLWQSVAEYCEWGGHAGPD